MKEVTGFLKVDLDLRAQEGLDQLIRELAPHVVFLHQTDGEASLEVSPELASAAAVIERSGELVDALSLAARRIWASCEKRTMNVGVQAGQSPHPAAFSLPASVVRLLARLEADVVFTVYAARAQVP